MKNKNKTPILAVIILLLVISGWFYFKNKNSSLAPLPQSKTAPKPKASLEELFTKKSEVKCRIKDKTNNNLSFVYMKGGKLRAEGISYSSSDGKNSQEGIMINDGQYVYIWDKAKKQGMKMRSKKEKQEKEKQEITPSQKEPSTKEMINNWQKSDRYSYHCQKTSLSDSLFIPPSDVQFVDIDALEKNFQDISPGQEKVSSEKLQKELKELQKSFGK